jgi:4a-hydroxytetrahydrobiopterin dehydratase
MNLKEQKCVPCREEESPLDVEEERKYLEQLEGWYLQKSGEHKIHKNFKFADFNASIEFVNKVAALAEDEGHHPNITINYNIVGLECFTHAIGGLSRNDFILAAKIDDLIT